MLCGGHGWCRWGVTGCDSGGVRGTHVDVVVPDPRSGNDSELRTRRERGSVPRPDRTGNHTVGVRKIGIVGADHDGNVAEKIAIDLREGTIAKQDKTTIGIRHGPRVVALRRPVRATHSSQPFRLEPAVSFESPPHNETAAEDRK